MHVHAVPARVYRPRTAYSVKAVAKHDVLGAFRFRNHNNGKGSAPSSQVIELTCTARLESNGTSGGFVLVPSLRGTARAC